MYSFSDDAYLQSKKQKENQISFLIESLPDHKVQPFYEWLNEQYGSWVRFSFFRGDSNLFFGITSSHSQKATMQVLKEIQRKLHQINRS